MHRRLHAALAFALLVLGACSAEPIPVSPTPDQPGPVEAAVLAAAAAPLADPRNVVFVMDALAEAPAAQVLIEIAPDLGRFLTPDERDAITVAFAGGGEVRFIHDPSTIVGGPGLGPGCHTLLGTLLTFSVPRLQSDGSFQLVRLQNHGCTGSSDLLEVTL